MRPSHPSRRALTLPYSGKRCARAATSSALSNRPSNPHARTRTPAAPGLHLDLHDRLADHREQPRRQRDQLRREVGVRDTGSDRRRRLPAPREQHRHEQLEPLHQPIRSFAHTRSSRQSIPRFALSRVCNPVPSGIPLGYPVSTLRLVPLEYPNA